MFQMDENKGIHVSRGDCVSIRTLVSCETEGGIIAIPIRGDACIIFTVKSRYSGETKIKRILTEDDYVDGRLTLTILPSETDFDPCGCEYSFMYVPDRNDMSEAYTYAQGEFEILPSVSTLKDLRD